MLPLKAIDSETTHSKQVAVSYLRALRHKLGTLRYPAYRAYLRVTELYGREPLITGTHGHPTPTFRGRPILTEAADVTVQALGQ